MIWLLLKVALGLWAAYWLAAAVFFVWWMWASSPWSVPN